MKIRYGRRNIRLGKRLSGEMSRRASVRSGKCPVGEVASWGIVRSGKWPSGNCPSGRCQSRICPRGNINWGTVLNFSDELKYFN